MTSLQNVSRAESLSTDTTTATASAANTNMDFFNT